jgi:hypothetical protein
MSEVGKPKEKITITPKVEPVPMREPLPAPTPVEVPQEQPVEEPVAA